MRRSDLLADFPFGRVLLMDETGDASGMDGVMAQDNNRLDDADGEVKPEPTLSLPGAGTTPTISWSAM